MAWRYKEWGGIKKAETEVVRIKGRRRDKGGGGWEKQISRVGRSTPIRLCEGHPPLMERFESYSNLTELKKLLYNHFDLETISN
jgi:hypothetical protein